eukprot:m.312697 g.312697  ORF g.312697 m.312697 type:complete len:81 (-) comp55396_c0_seq1:93-335(-)
MYDALASHMFCSLNLQQSCGADEPDSNVEQEPANRTHDVFPEQPLYSFSRCPHHYHAVNPLVCVQGADERVRTSHPGPGP